MVPGLRVQEFHIGSFKWDIVPLQEGVCQSFPCIAIWSYVDVVAFHFVVLPKFCNQTVGCTPRSRPIQSMVVLLDDMIQHNSCWVLSRKILPTDMTNEWPVPPKKLACPAPMWCHVTNPKLDDVSSQSKKLIGFIISKLRDIQVERLDE